ncbi:MAG: DegT/DnrJ/EryC1/StrS family aminotransferase [Elusimicrobia bacterium]|nr:DegT/DnrJ/EryC1/StrS family aminotransferase [Elusimicrobiota bacterium]
MKVPYVDFQAQYATERRPLLHAIDRVLSRGEYILGREVAAFESALARLCGVRHAVGVANGTDALILTLKALGIGPGHEVITVPNSFVASASCIALAGAQPVFVDVGPDQLMDPRQLERAFTRRTKAVIPVHLTGKCCDMDAIGAAARRRGLPVIEDAAQAVGARYHGRRAGSLGRAACLSFHPLKNLNAAGDAGAVVTDDPRLAERLRLLRNHGLRSRDEVLFWGFNSRLDALQAAILRSRLKRLRAVVARRRRNAETYRHALADLTDVVQCPQDAPDCQDTYHLFVIQCDRRDALQSFLARRGVATAVHYPTPIHLQPCCADLGYRQGDFPEAERQARRILSLPVHQHLKRSQLAYVIHCIRNCYGR